MQAKCRFTFSAFLVVSVIFVIVLSTLVTYSQQRVDEPPFIIQSNETGELHSRNTDFLAVEAQQTNERLIVISRQGSIDTNRFISYNRLLRLKGYYSATRRTFGTRDPIFAVGDRVKGEGRIEYYIGSNLRMVVYAPRNSFPMFTCCEDYNPTLKPSRKKVSIRS